MRQRNSAFRGRVRFGVWWWVGVVWPRGARGQQVTGSKRQPTTKVGREGAGNRGGQPRVSCRDLSRLVGWSGVGQETKKGSPPGWGCQVGSQLGEDGERITVV